jgi:hypothetical protein
MHSVNFVSIPAEELQSTAQESQASRIAQAGPSSLFKNPRNQSIPTAPFLPPLFEAHRGSSASVCGTPPV